MAIKLPDIVQRVVLDTRKFSMGAKGAQKELASTADSAKGAAKALDQQADSHRKAGDATTAHQSKAQKFNQAMRAGTPSVLRLADNLYKVRHRHTEAARAAEKNSKSHGRLHKMLHKLGSKLKSVAFGIAKFGLKVGIIGALALAAAPMIGALSGALLTLVGSLGRVIGLLPALSGGLIGLVAIAGTVMLAFSGVKAAMKQQSKAGSAAGKSAKAVAKAQESGAKAIASAQKAVASATKSLADARKDEAEAYAAIGEAQYEAQKRVAESTRGLYMAQRTLAESQSKTRSAQEALTRSYEEAKRALEDLRRENERSDIAYQRSEEAVRNARQRILDLQAAGAGPEELSDAMLDLRSAELDVADAADNLKDSNEALADAERKGIKNSDTVNQARNELAQAKQDEADATYELREAEIGLMEAQYEGAKSVAEAQDRAAEATERVAEAQDELAEAIAGVAEARQDAAESVSDAADSGGSGAEKDPSITPEATAIAKALKTAKDELKPLKTMVQKITFRDIITGIQKGTKLILGFKDNLRDTAKIISGQFAKFPDYLAMAAPSIRNIWTANNKLISSIGDLGGVMVVGAARMAEAGSFVLDHFAGVADEVRGRMENALANPETFSKMQAFFLKALDAATQWWRILRDFSIGLIKFIGIGSDMGTDMARNLAEVGARFREWTNDESNRKKTLDFFTRARDLASKIGKFLWDIIVGITGIATGPAIGAIGDLFDKIGAAFGSANGGRSLSEFISTVGTEAVIRGAEAIGGIVDALSGKKEAGTNAEKIAVAFSDISDVMDVGSAFADILLKVGDGLKWIVDNVPGAKLILGGIAGVMAAFKVAKLMGITGAFRGLGSIVRFVNEQRNGVPKTNRLLADANRVIGATPQPSKWRIVNFLRGVKTEAPGAQRELQETGTQMSLFDDKVVKADPKARKFQGRLRGLGSMAVDASTGIGLAGGAMWAMSSIVGDNALGDALNKIGAGMVLIGTVADIASTLGAFSGGMKAVDGATKGAAASQTALNTAWLASPITWIVVAIVAIGAALFALYKKNEGFRKFVDNLWQSIQKAWDKILAVLAPVGAFFKEKILGAVQTVYNWVKDHWKILAVLFGGPIGIAVALISTHFDTIKNFILETLVPALMRIWEVAKATFTGFVDAARAAWEFLRPIFMGLWDFIKFVFTAIAELIGAWWRLWIQPILKLVWAYITNVLVPVFKFLWGIVKFVFTMIGEWVGYIWRTFLKPTWDRFYGFIKDKLIPWFQKLWDKWTEVWDNVKLGLAIAWDFIKPKLQALRDFIQDKIIDKFNSLKSAASDAWDTISNGFSKAWSLAKSGMNAALRSLGGIIKPFLDGAAIVADALGMDYTRDGLRDAATSVGKWGKEGASGGLVGGRHSPPEAAAGSRFINARRNPTPIGGGFKTGTPKAIVGEATRHPEYVIPTDPRYRTRAKSLLFSAAKDLGRGPSGRFGTPGIRDLGTGGRVPEFDIGDMLNGLRKTPGGVLNWAMDGVRGFTADRIEDLWPEDWVAEKDRTPKGIFSMNTFRSILHKARGTLIDKIRGKAEEKADERDAATGGANGATGINPQFLHLYKMWNYALGNKFSVGSGFRTFEEQLRLWYKYGQDPHRVANPWKGSNHMRGLAIDLSPSNTTEAERALGARYGLRWPMSWEPWHVEPSNKLNPMQGFIDAVAKWGYPKLGNGGIVMGDTLARIGELGKPEAVVPLDSPTGRRMLGEGGPNIVVDMRNMHISTGDPSEVKKAATEAVEEALDAISEFVEIKL